MGQQIKIKVNSQLRELLLTHIQTTKHSDIPPNIEDIINVKSSNLYAKQKSKNKSSDDPSESSTKENEEFLSVSDMRWLHDNVVKNLENVYLHEMLGMYSEIMSRFFFFFLLNFVVGNSVPILV